MMVIGSAPFFCYTHIVTKKRKELDSMEITNEQRLALKGKGYITMRDPAYFSCRVLLPAGKITAA